jgi:hypothetical protein
MSVEELVEVAEDLPLFCPALGLPVRLLLPCKTTHILLPESFVPLLHLFCLWPPFPYLLYKGPRFMRRSWNAASGVDLGVISRIGGHGPWEGPST